MALPSPSYKNMQLSHTLQPVKQFGKWIAFAEKKSISRQDNDEWPKLIIFFV